MDTAVQDQAVAETNRDRVRRLLFAPLDFRRPKGVNPDAHEVTLNDLADELRYMADDRLAALAEALRGKGEGPARNQWPGKATVRAFAEMFQPRPVQELPALLSWFASVEGPKAMAQGTLVETWQYVGRCKVPPATPAARAVVAQLAADNARRLTIIAERRAAGLGISADDAGWEQWYIALRDRCAAIVAQQRDGKAVAHA